MNHLWDKLQLYWQEQRRVVVLGGILALFAVISLLVNLPSWSSHGNSVKDELALLTDKQQELGKLLAQKRQLQTPLELVRQMPERFWNPDTDGNPAIELRRKIENAAQQAGLSLRSIGALQNSKVAEGVMSYEVAIEGQAKYSELLEFMKQLQGAGERRIFCNTLTINPDNMKAPNFYLVRGTLRTVAVAHPEIRKLWRAEP